MKSVLQSKNKNDFRVYTILKTWHISIIKQIGSLTGFWWTNVKWHDHTLNV